MNSITPSPKENIIPIGLNILPTIFRNAPTVPPIAPKNLPPAPSPDMKFLIPVKISLKGLNIVLADSDINVNAPPPTFLIDSITVATLP